MAVTDCPREKHFSQFYCCSLVLLGDKEGPGERPRSPRQGELQLWALLPQGVCCQGREVSGHCLGGGL